MINSSKKIRLRIKTSKIYYIYYIYIRVSFPRNSYDDNKL